MQCSATHTGRVATLHTGVPPIEELEGSSSSDSTGTAAMLSLLATFNVAASVGGTTRTAAS